MIQALRLSHVRLTAAAGDVLRGLLGVLLPETCPLCGRDVPPGRGLLECESCAENLQRIDRCCRRCSAPIGPYLDASKPCRLCRRDRFAFERAFSAGVYRDLFRSAVLAAKRPGGGAASGWLAEYLWRCRGDELAALGVDLVVPVPQHWTRRLTAPHNAAEAIARRLAARLKAPLGRHILVKIRRTPSQTSLTPSARRENLGACFLALRPLHGRRVLLVDDVLTTGTTAHRASRALLNAGADVVWAAAPARGVGS